MNVKLAARSYAIYLLTTLLLNFKFNLGLKLLPKPDIWNCECEDGFELAGLECVKKYTRAKKLAFEASCPNYLGHNSTLLLPTPVVYTVIGLIIFLLVGIFIALGYIIFRLHRKEMSGQMGSGF